MSISHIAKEIGSGTKLTVSKGSLRKWCHFHEQAFPAKKAAVLTVIDKILQKKEDFKTTNFFSAKNPLSSQVGLPLEISGTKTMGRSQSVIEELKSEEKEKVSPESEMIEAKKSLIALCKQNPVTNLRVVWLMERKMCMREGAIARAAIYWEPTKKDILLGSRYDKAYVNRAELTNTYSFSADVYLEEGIYYVNLNRESGEHIEAREWRGNSLTDWKIDASKEELDEKYAEALAFIKA